MRIDNGGKYVSLKPSVAHMHGFGTLLYFHIPSDIRTKLQPKASSRLFLGYSTTSKAYRVWDLNKHRVVISRDIICDESTSAIAKSICSLYYIEGPSSLVPTDGSTDVSTIPLAESDSHEREQAESTPI